jgi:SAM-dependent methyltransferase
MRSHLYNSRLGKVAWFVRRFGAGELLLKPLRCAFAPLIIPRLARAEFVFEDKSLPLFYHRYNMTWANERAVEVPVAGEFLRRFAGKRVLEVGNVTPHYLDTGHTVLDKFERGPGIINEDIAGFAPGERFDLILSVSTFEHIGYDDEANGESGEKISQAITTCRGLLTAGGQLVLTLPLGYNPALDRMIADGQLGCDRATFLKRTGRLAWQTVDAEAALASEYGRPFPYANAVMIAQFGGLPK